MKVTVTIKFVFHLKSGNTFECIEDLNEVVFLQMVGTVKESFKEGVEGVLMFSDCCVRLSECAVVEWEVLSESQEEESQ